MNLRVCKSLGRIEFRRFMKATGFPRPDGMEALRELLDLAWGVFVPQAFEAEIDCPTGDVMVMRNARGFAHEGMVGAGRIGEYACDIFERIEGWFNAMGLDYTRAPDLIRCLKYRGKECGVTIRFRFRRVEDTIR